MADQIRVKSESGRLRTYMRQGVTADSMESVRDRAERIRRENREQDACHHGRRRKVGVSDLKPWAGPECKTGQCSTIYLSAFEVFTQWRDTDDAA
jgi:hypothetical protein